MIKPSATFAELEEHFTQLCRSTLVYYRLLKQKNMLTPLLSTEQGAELEAVLVQYYPVLHDIKRVLNAQRVSIPAMYDMLAQKDACALSGEERQKLDGLVERVGALVGSLTPPDASVETADQTIRHVQSLLGS